MVDEKLFISQNQVSHSCITVVCMFWCIGNGAGLSYIPNLFDRFSGLRSKRALASDSFSMLFLKWSLLHSELFTLAIRASSSTSTKSKSIFWNARTNQIWKIKWLSNGYKLPLMVQILFPSILEAYLVPRKECEAFHQALPCLLARVQMHGTFLESLFEMPHHWPLLDHDKNPQWFWILSES